MDGRLGQRPACPRQAAVQEAGAKVVEEAVVELGGCADLARGAEGEENAVERVGVDGHRLDRRPAGAAVLQVIGYQPGEGGLSGSFRTS